MKFICWVYCNDYSSCSFKASIYGELNSVLLEESKPRLFLGEKNIFRFSNQNTTTQVIHIEINYLTPTNPKVEYFRDFNTIINMEYHIYRYKHINIINKEYKNQVLTDSYYISLNSKIKLVPYIRYYTNGKDGTKPQIEISGRFNELQILPLNQPTIFKTRSIFYLLSRDVLIHFFHVVNCEIILIYFYSSSGTSVIINNM